MTFKWKTFLDGAPTESGYYYAVHLMNDQLYYKAIAWHTQKGVWLHWRYAMAVAMIPPDVLAFVPESRNDFYCPCMEAVRENLHLYTAFEAD